ncbi:hypothetical protein [Kordiimonas pumila]|uniref:Uncharacterized protein n=1 Tax=Kordiimonas pumila TaxID=2161677 RepID=A0ABV7D1U4_9PROT|nr:hypothetical protein [Kordiimonas pumila]
MFGPFKNRFPLLTAAYATLLFGLIAPAGAAAVQEITMGYPLPQCQAGAEMETASIVIGKNQRYTVCPDVRTLAISSLVMEQGAILELPSSAERFDLVINTGRFERRTQIMARRLSPLGANGANVKVTINNATFDFSQEIDTGYPEATTDEQAAITAAIIERAVAGGQIVAENVKFQILSAGLMGAGGATGSTGYAAQRKQCMGTDGHAAGPGGQGGAGGKGGNGGYIHAIIRLAPDHTPVSNNDIMLTSKPGMGGPGGLGGAGGAGAPGSDCWPSGHRSPWPQGPQGPRGPKGPDGQAIPPLLDLQFYSN